MPLTTEDGTGLAGAESLCSVATADAYHAARGTAAWAALTTDAKEQALRRATDHMQQTYRLLWSGERRYLAQALDWPREWVPRPDYDDYYPADVVPTEVQRACAELAYRGRAGGELLADQSREVIEQTVGPITTKYAQGASQARRYAAVDALLAPFLKAPKGGAVMRLVRA